MKLSIFASAAVLLSGALLLSGCTQNSQVQPQVPPTPAAGSQVPSAPATAPESPSDTPASTQAPIASGEPTAPASTNSKPVGCTPDQLSAKEGAGNGGAGTDYHDLVFTNTSNETCTLEGYPKVQAVGSGNGTTLGTASHAYWNWRDEGGVSKSDQPNEHVILKPGAKAYVNFAQPSVYNYTDSYAKDKGVYEQEYNATCGSVVKADGLRVQLPGENASLFLDIKGGLPVCSAPSDNDLRASEFVSKATAI